MWRAFAWGFDAVVCNSLQPRVLTRVKALPSGSSTWCPSAWTNVSLYCLQPQQGVLEGRGSIKPCLILTYNTKCSEEFSCQSPIITGEAVFSLKKPKRQPHSTLILVYMIIKGKKSLLKTQLKMVQEIRMKIKH